MWDGAKLPILRPTTGMLRMSGVPPSGSRSTRGLKAAHEARGRSSPSRVTIADAGGRRAFPLPPQASPHGDRQGRRTVPPISPGAKRALRAASLSGPLDEIGSPSAAALPMLPRAVLPPSHPRLAVWQAVWQGHPPSQLQGAFPMKAPALGSIRLGNKRAGAPGKPGPGEVAVDIDRKNRILGNPFVLHNPKRRRRPPRRHRALPRQIRSRPQMRWPDERRNRSPRRTRPKGRAPGLHVLVLAEALSRRHRHRRDQAPPRMRGRTTRRCRDRWEPPLSPFPPFSRRSIGAISRT